MRRALCLGLGALALAGCGSGTRGGALEWKGGPAAFTPKTMPTDHVVMGTVRNASFSDELTLDAGDLRVVDAAGRGVQGHAQFIAGFAHGLYGAYQRPRRIEESELLRLGLRVRLRPGRTAPLYVAYRVRPGLKLPVHVDYGTGTLSLPSNPA